LVAYSSHYLTYMDDSIVYATAQSEQLSVDLGVVAYRGRRPPTACLTYNEIIVVRAAMYYYCFRLS